MARSLLDLAHHFELAALDVPYGHAIIAARRGMIEPIQFLTRPGVNSLLALPRADVPDANGAVLAGRENIRLRRPGDCHSGDRLTMAAQYHGRRLRLCRLNDHAHSLRQPLG